MTRRPSRKQERDSLVTSLRKQGLTWVEIAEILRERYSYNARAAIRLAHGWSQQQAANEWNRRWPNELKVAKNFSYWETWPESGHAPSLRTLDRLAQLYGCCTSDLLADISDYRHLDDSPPSVVILGATEITHSSPLGEE